MRVKNRVYYLIRVLILLAALMFALFLMSCGQSTGDPENETPASTPDLEDNIAEQESTEELSDETPAPDLLIFDQRLESFEVIQPELSDDVDYFTEGLETKITASFIYEIDYLFTDGIPLCYVSVSKEDEFLTQIAATGYPPGSNLIFQPKSIIDTGGWAEGSYTFKLFLGDSEDGPAAILNTDFEKPGGGFPETKARPEIDENSKAPVFINVPDDPSEVKTSEEIRFEADIFDNQDGWLTGEEVTWTLDGRDYTKGNILLVWAYELPPGNHVFKCTAVNGAGTSSSKEFEFAVTFDESDLQDDWSRKEIEEALSKGLILPMNRLDMPVSRSQFTGLLLDFYNSCSEKGEQKEDYIADFFIEQNKAQSEEVAALFMSRVVSFTINDFFGTGSDETAILDAFKDLGILSEYGPDMYQPAENLSNRLALVRLNRLYDSVFSNKIRIVAASFAKFECDDAAYAMRALLIREGQQGALVSLFFPGGFNVYTEVTEGKKTLISETGFHIGVLYAGRIHCNIYPVGLPEKEWIESFFENSGKEPHIEYAPF